MRSKLEDNRLTLYLEGRLGIDNAQAVLDELMDAVAANPDADVVLDAGDLEYISSSGLRTLVELFKKTEPLPIVNVCPDVYNVFEITGFTTLTGILRKPREISLDGYEVIGQGASATVYRMDEETVVKIFDPAIGIERIERERENAKAAFVSGLPTAIPFDTVHCSDGYGTVYELVDAVTLSRFMLDNPDKALEYRAKYACVMKDMHRVSLPDTFQSVNALYKKWVRSLDAYLADGEIESLVRFIDAIPTHDGVVHGDCHVGNILVQHGELVLIDMADISRGHPFFDIGSEYFHYKVAAHVDGVRPIIMRSVLGFVPDDNDMTDAIWDALMQGYFDPESEADSRAIDDIARGGGLLRLVALMAKHAQLSDDVKRAGIDYARQHFFPYIDEYIEKLGMLDRYFHTS